MEGMLDGRGRSLRSVLSAMVLTVVSGSLSGSSLVRAGAPKVIFDVGQVVECRDVTPDSFSQTNPTEKVIEARFRVSVLVTQGRPKDIEEVMVTLVSPKRRLRVVDFSPKTRLTTNVVGDVEMVETTEVEKSLNASVGGRVAGEYGVGRIDVSPSAGVGKVKRNLSKETFRRLPPKTSVLVSGTTDREYGVFFKLKPSEQESMEGLKEFTCRWVVPTSWRGDWAMVTCQARGYSRNLFYASLKQCGFTKIPIGLYLRGDATAKRMATRLSRGAVYRASTPRGQAHFSASRPGQERTSVDRKTSQTRTRERVPPGRVTDPDDVTSTPASYARVAGQPPHIAFKPVVTEGVFGRGSWKLPTFEHRPGNPLAIRRASYGGPPSAGKRKAAASGANRGLRPTLDALGSLSGRGLSAAHPVLKVERATRRPSAAARALRTN